MSKITYVEPSGARYDLWVPAGQTVMDGAVQNNIRGIDADCGGACACATCHVYVDEAWLAATGQPSALEAAMLEFAQGVQPNSRLACQIKVTDELFGLVVTVAAEQR